MPVEVEQVENVTVVVTDVRLVVTSSDEIELVVVEEMSHSLPPSGDIALGLLGVEVVEIDVVNEYLVGDSSEQESEHAVQFVAVVEEGEQLPPLDVGHELLQRSETDGVGQVVVNVGHILHLLETHL